MIFHSDKTLRGDEIHASWRWAHFRSRDHQQVSHIQYIYIHIRLFWCGLFLISFTFQCSFLEKDPAEYTISTAPTFLHEILSLVNQFSACCWGWKCPSKHWSPRFWLSIKLQGVPHNRYNLSQRTGLWLKNLTFSSSPLLTCIDQVLHGWA